MERLRNCRLGESVSLGVGSEVSKALASPGSSLCLMLDPHGVKVRALSDRDSATPRLSSCWPVPMLTTHGGHKLQINLAIGPYHSSREVSKRPDWRVSHVREHRTTRSACRARK